MVWRWCGPGVELVWAQFPDRLEQFQVAVEKILLKDSEVPTMFLMGFLLDCGVGLVWSWCGTGVELVWKWRGPKNSENRPKTSKIIRRRDNFWSGQKAATAKIFPVGYPF